MTLAPTSTGVNMQTLAHPSKANWRRRTWLFIGGTAAVWSIYDLWAMSKGGLEATISDNVKKAASEWPAVPFLCGALMAHFYWYQTNTVVVTQQDAAGNVINVQEVRRRDLPRMLERN